MGTFEILQVLDCKFLVGIFRLEVSKTKDFAQVFLACEPI